MKIEKFAKYIKENVRRFSFYSTVTFSLLVLVSFQNCGKVKFSAPRTRAIIPQSCGTITMVPQNGLTENTNVTFTIVPPTGITISNISWDVRKGAAIVHTSLVNPMSHTFNHSDEGPGSYVATAIFDKNDGSSCELEQSFQIISGDLCVDPSGISGPTVGFTGEETSPFSIDYEDCFVGTVAWDMDTNGIPEYNNLVSDSVTYTYQTPGTYTVTARVINSDDNSQTILTHNIVISTRVGYSWLEGNWSACSATLCGTTGNQTRSVVCRRSDGVTVADSFCSSVPKPATSRVCSTNACLACPLPWGGVLAQGQSVTAYSASQVACGQSCASQVRVCNNGVLSGTYTNQTCSVAACPVNGVCGSANGTSSTSAPTANLCSVGTASQVSTGAANYTWTCAGSNGGSTASCSATRQLFATSSCGFSLTSSNWSGSAGQPTSSYNSCEWAGSMYMGSSSRVDPIFFFGDYYDTNGGVHRLTNPTQWTITAPGCTFGTIVDPQNYQKKMPNYCRGSSQTYNGVTPLVWNITVTARNNLTGEVRTLPIRATFKPTVRNSP